MSAPFNKKRWLKIKIYKSILSEDTQQHIIQPITNSQSRVNQEGTVEKENNDREPGDLIEIDSNGKNNYACLK